MEYNKNLLYISLIMVYLLCTDILLLKTKVLKDYKNGIRPSYNKYCVDNAKSCTEELINCTKIKTYLDDFNIIIIYL